MPATRWSKWFWSDWMTDKGLRVCSYAARGLWIDMLAIMAESEKVGYLMIAGRPLSAEELARATGGTVEEVLPLLAELEAAKVFSRDKAKNLYSRRLVRDENRRRSSAAGGKKGGPASLEKETGIHATRGTTRDDTREETRPLTGARSLESRVQSPEREETTSSEDSRTPRVRDASYNPAHALAELVRVANGNVDRTASAIRDLTPIEEMLDAGALFEADVLEAVRENVPKLKSPLRTWRAPWLRAAVMELRAERLRGDGVHVLEIPSSTPETLEKIRRSQAKLWLKMFWHDDWGDPPNVDKVRFPADFMDDVAREAGIDLTYARHRA